MMYPEKPADFAPRFEIVSCFVEHEGALLFLLRQSHKPQPNTWGVPAGKVEPGETSAEAMARELAEETSIECALAAFSHAHTVYVRYPEFDFTYHIFRLPLSETPAVHIDPSSHQAFRWATPAEAHTLPLIPDLDACIALVYPEHTPSA